MLKPQFAVVLLLTLCLAVLPRPGRAQTTTGQYEEEAPVGTWNILGPMGAAGLSLAETIFVRGDDASVLFANPALLTRLPRLSVSLGGYIQSASFFRYGPVNTGPVSTEGNAGLRTAAADLAALSFSLLGWRVGLGLGLSEVFDRPAVEGRSSSSYYVFSFQQTGYLRSLNVSLAREVARGLSLGLGLNLVSGRWEWKMTEAWSAATITDSRERSIKGSFINGGLHWQVSDRFSLAAAFRTPYERKADSRSLLHYEAQNADILIQADGQDAFRQPLVLGLGLDWRCFRLFRLAGQISYWNWSSYRASLFGEEQARAFEDIWKAGLGLEYMNTLRLFGQDFDFPFRLGLVYDPQPMSSPRSSYFKFSLGFGLQWHGFRLDMGTLVAAEKGSGWDLTAHRVALTLTWSSGPGPGKG